MEAAILKAVFGLLGGMILFFMKNHHDKIKSLESENAALKNALALLDKNMTKEIGLSKDSVFAYCGDTKKTLRQELESFRDNLELKIKSSTIELENILDNKSIAQIKAIDRRFSDISEETNKISEIEKQLQANTTDIEWLKKQGK